MHDPGDIEYRMLGVEGMEEPQSLNNRVGLHWIDDKTIAAAFC